MIIGTVVTSSHLSRAMVLAKSIKRHNPEIKVVVSLVERKMIPDLEHFEFFDEVVLTQDTWRGEDEFDRVIFKYDAWEACCFAKALLFDYIFNKYSEENHVLFLDSDTEVVSSLRDLPSRFDRSSILLTPQHLYKGMEYDDFKYGVYNAGMIGVTRSPDGLNFVKWWKKRLERHSYFGDYDTLFAEQKWLNLVPSIFDHVEVIKHPGYNIAGWNFPERKIDYNSHGEFTVNGEPLYVFHFHNFGSLEQEAKGDEFKAHNPVLEELITQYAEKLNEMRRFSYALIPWSYNFFSDGSLILRESRLIYRNNLALEKKHPYPFFMNNSLLAQYQGRDIIDEGPAKKKLTRPARANKTRKFRQRRKFRKIQQRLRHFKKPIRVRRKNRHGVAYYLNRAIYGKTPSLKIINSFLNSRQAKLIRRALILKQKIPVELITSPSRNKRPNKKLLRQSLKKLNHGERVYFQNLTRVFRNPKIKVGEGKLLINGKKNV